MWLLSLEASDCITAFPSPLFWGDSARMCFLLDTCVRPSPVPRLLSTAASMTFLRPQGPVWLRRPQGLCTAWDQRLLQSWRLVPSLAALHSLPGHPGQSRAHWQPPCFCSCSPAIGVLASLSVSPNCAALLKGKLSSLPHRGWPSGFESVPSPTKVAVGLESVTLLHC